jgi:TPR repeat protein
VLSNIETIRQLIDAEKETSVAIYKWVDVAQNDLNLKIRSNAYYVLSYYYEFAWFVPKDLDKARHFLEQAASLGHAEACYELARKFLLERANEEGRALFWIHQGLSQVDDESFNCGRINYIQGSLKEDLEALKKICINMINQKEQQQAINKPIPKI